jgi:CubicO group peptidase (beta-lactamase class C family)
VAPRTRRELLGLGAGLGATGVAGCLDLTPVGSETWGSDAGEIPTTGEFVPELRAYENTVTEFMVEQDIPGGVLGVAKDGEILLERGYGYRDADRTEPMALTTQLRIASLTKAFTRAAVRKLERDGRLNFSQSAVSLLDIEPLPGESYNDRLDEITIGHLLGHRGGWDREAAYDPLFVQIEIALERGWDSPPDERRLLRYMLSEPLQFDPGSRRVYSNLGYLVLGLVVEAVTGVSYQQYIQQELFDPLGITDIELGRSLPTDRPDRETWYFDQRACRNVVEMNPTELVRCPDGGFHQEATSASGGQIATIDALLAFMRAYWLDGRPRLEGQQRTQVYSGTLPGTFSKAIQYRGVDVVVVFNQRGYDPNYHDIRTELIDATESTEK